MVVVSAGGADGPAELRQLVLVWQCICGLRSAQVWRGSVVDSVVYTAETKRFFKHFILLQFNSNNKGNWDRQSVIK